MFEMSHQSLPIEMSICIVSHNPSISSSVSDCSSSSWFLIKLPIGHSSWWETVYPGMNLHLLSSTTMPFDTSARSVFKHPLLCCKTPGWLMIIGHTSKSVVDLRSLGKKHPSLSMTKLCNLAAAPQISLKCSRWIPTGHQKICHLVGSNPKAISHLILNWFKWKSCVWLVGTCFLAPLNGMRTESDSEWALSSMMKYLSGRLSIHLAQLNAIVKCSGIICPAWSNGTKANEAQVCIHQRLDIDSMLLVISTVAVCCVVCILWFVDATQPTIDDANTTMKHSKRSWFLIPYRGTPFQFFGRPRNINGEWFVDCLNKWFDLLVCNRDGNPKLWCCILWCQPPKEPEAHSSCKLQGNGTTSNCLLPLIFLEDRRKDPHKFLKGSNSHVTVSRKGIDRLF